MVPEGDLPNIQTWVDSDWADDPETRRSCSGGVLCLYGVAICSWARTQAAPALSSCEAELYAIGSGCVESLGVRSLLLEMGLPAVVQVRTDSSSACRIVEDLAR